MPYIARERRADLDETINHLGYILGVLGHKPGDLNYVISRLVGNKWLSNPRYQSIAEITGVLENVKQEFYRRTAAPYEDSAIKKNGDLKEMECYPRLDTEGGA